MVTISASVYDMGAKLHTQMIRLTKETGKSGSFLISQTQTEMRFLPGSAAITANSLILKHRVSSAFTAGTTTIFNGSKVAGLPGAMQKGSPQ